MIAYEGGMLLLQLVQNNDNIFSLQWEHQIPFYL